MSDTPTLPPAGQGAGTPLPPVDANEAAFLAEKERIVAEHRARNQRRAENVKIDEGALRIAADSNLIVIGDAKLFDHGWKNDSEARDAFVLDIGLDWTKIDPINRDQIAEAQAQADLVAKRVPKTVRREQLVDGTWRLHVLDGNQAGTIHQGCMENVTRDNLMVRVDKRHKDQSRVRVLDACREKGFGKTSVPGAHSTAEFFGIAMRDPLRYRVHSDENGPFKIELILR